MPSHIPLGPAQEVDRRLGKGEVLIRQTGIGALRRGDRVPRARTTTGSHGGGEMCKVDSGSPTGSSQPQGGVLGGGGVSQASPGKMRIREGSVTQSLRPAALWPHRPPLRSPARPAAPTYRRRRGDPGRTSAPPPPLQHGRLLRAGSALCFRFRDLARLVTLDPSISLPPPVWGRSRLSTREGCLEVVA